MGRAARKQNNNIALVHNADIDKKARASGPQLKKKWTLHDLNTIKPITKNQQRAFEYWQEGYNLVFAGAAGTGKTFSAIYLALLSLLDKDSNYPEYSTIDIIRSIVPTRDIGFLKGDNEEKVEVYEDVYHSIFDEMFPYKKSYENLKEIGKVRFSPTSFNRGKTFNDSIMVVDEFSNMNFHELDSTITRVGDNTRIIFSGDIAQTDLIYKKNDTSGFVPFMDIVQSMRNSFKIIEFDTDDIVRSGLVKEYLVAKNVLDSFALK